VLSFKTRGRGETRRAGRGPITAARRKRSNESKTKLTGLRRWILEPRSERPVGVGWKEECALASQACILVIDDDASVLQLIEDVLSPDYDVEAVSDPLIGLELLGREHFDALIVDLGMPRLDGVELIQRLRAQPDTRELPIIAVSAFDQLRERIANVPVNAVIGKPFSVRGFERTVARVVHHQPLGKG
jgi:CheY-like chemotaxis protein